MAAFDLVMGARSSGKNWETYLTLDFWLWITEFQRCESHVELPIFDKVMIVHSLRSAWG